MQDPQSKSYYAVITANVRYDVRLCANEKLMFGEITALCNERGYCWASNKYFAELYKVKKETISRWISSLVNCGYIKTKIVYKEGTKEISGRHIFLSQEGIDAKINTPIDQILKDNSTIINNTDNNISSPSPKEVTQSDLIIDFVEKSESTLEEKIIKKFHSLFCKFRTKPGQPFKNKTLSKSKMSAWKDDLDKMMRIDQVSREDLLEVYHFLNTGNDDFWRNNIYSLAAIRKYWDKIQDKIRTESLRKEKEAQKAQEQQKSTNTRVLPGVVKK